MGRDPRTGRLFPGSIDLLAGADDARVAPGSAQSRPSANGGGAGRWLGVYFRCARQYTRVFRRDSDGEASYLARCPKCGQTIGFKVDPNDPTSRGERFYQVSC
jgi:hypothetical protein